MTHEKAEKSLIIIKPDAIQRSLVGAIIQRFENKGLVIVGMKMMYLKDAVLTDHYKHIADKPFFPRIQKFMQSAPVIIMAVTGINCVSAIRTIVGPTKGFEAAGGTIRGDYSMSIQANVVHASESVEAANEEIKRFFDDSEIVEYEKVDTKFVFSDDLM